ncbi:MAG TPA: DUF2231 domain-containing protein [Candidatus Cybelea sp.]|jgi:uncharacterized membrane protein|nr:DUF2231 domain-containing protein [Candidatus Cybelea sp.]
MQGKATLGGHPLHPMLVTFPIGCFVAAVVSDVISIWAGPVFWAAMSTWLILFGIAGALLAAFFGFVDYISAPMTVRAKSIAAWHMTLNIAAIVIFGWACAIRFLDHTSVAGYALTGLGIVLIGISGWMGGEVAHRHLVGSSEADARVTREAADHTAMSPRERELSMLSARRR